MMHPAHAQDYESWRTTARSLLRAGIPHMQVDWNKAANQQSLFTEEPLPAANSTHVHTVPAEFLSLAQTVCCHRHPERFNLLYAMLWRLNYEDKNLLKILSDPLTNTLNLMGKSVRRDVHKTKAFVRFRKIETESVEHFIAWHCPDHYSLSLTAPFFKRRFTVMKWSILTPDESAHWDGTHLRMGPGADITDAPSHDAMEELWKDFYRAIFNPARISISAMKKEMPVRHWKTLPEASIIPDLLKEAPARVERMIATQEGFARTAADFIPENPTLEHLREAASTCQGCPLYQQNHHTVFGEGPANARLMLIGEQPGDEEDKQGKPFIGPAGEVLNRALAEAGINRSEIYITNAVKHFKFTRTGKERLHRSPSLKDIINCKPWLEWEIKNVQPSVAVCLGVSASRSLISPGFTLKAGQGEVFRQGELSLVPTYHPSAVLRSADTKTIYDTLVADLRKASHLLS